MDIDDKIEEKEKYISIKVVVINFIVLVVVFFVCFYELPYYIDRPGGLDNINDKVQVDGAYKVKGTMNLTYVSELRGTIPALIMAYLHPDWTIIPKSDANVGTLTYETDLIRQSILMHQSYTTAIMYAYQKANKKVDIKSEKCYVIYKLEDSDSDLEVGDQIVKIDDFEVNSYEELGTFIAKKKIGDTSTVQVINDGKEYTRKIVYTGEDDQPVIGVQIGVEYELETDPKYEFSFNNSEYGPSGGLMVSLAVYNSLVKDDITGGKTIAGTGTLDIEGNVGPVGGIEYKLKGAVKDKADVFFAPSFENYDEAMKLKKEKGYDIDIVKVETFEDALKYLEDKIMKK